MTLNLALTDTQLVRKISVCSWDWNLQNSNRSQHANYLCHLCLYDTEVVRRIVYLILTAA